MLCPQRRYREDGLFHSQQHRLSAAQRNRTRGHSGDGLSAPTRQVRLSCYSLCRFCLCAHYSRQLQQNQVHNFTQLSLTELNQEHF
ncbi:hypothetical protein GOODEAATRI_030768 [Goodea atripinnis]|uniref:Uncharacterized protein n=1 Tax=Goodea atripinnis TaxID=208336 RepID=A0ABV0Q2X4_9TELE